VGSALAPPGLQLDYCLGRNDVGRAGTGACTYEVWEASCRGFGGVPQDWGARGLKNPIGNDGSGAAGCCRDSEGVPQFPYFFP